MPDIRNQYKDTLRNSREKILQLLKAHPVYSAKKLADAIGITEKGVLNVHLPKLAKIEKPNPVKQIAVQ